MSNQNGFIAALGVGQIVSWGTLYYAFPLIAGPMAAELGLGRPDVYSLASLALIVAAGAAYPVGAAIDRGLGRWVMAVGAVLAGAMLIAWGRASNLTSLYLIFAVIGIAQAMTLYDPAFAVVVRRFGMNARRGITALTLWGGFASTVFVPLVQWLMDSIGWRDALMVLGGCNLLLCAGLYALAIQPARDLIAAAPPRVPGSRRPAVIGPVLRRPAFWALMVSFTLFFGAVTALFYHLYPLLIERGLEPAEVVFVIALIGPSQVVARVLVGSFAGAYPVRVIGMITISVFPFAFALLALPPSTPLLWLFAIVFGGANGILTIVRGLVVPEMLTRQSYGAINGLLAAPGSLAKAVAPMLAAALWAAAGSYDAVVAAIILAAIIMALAFGVAVRTSRASSEV